MRRALLSLALLGCFKPAERADINQYEDDDLPAGVCRGTGGEAETDGCDTEGTTAASDDLPASTGTGGDRCISSSDCEGGFCAAGWDPETLTRTPLDCQFACVPTQDDAAWCADASACCDRNATCTRRGYCVVD